MRAPITVAALALGLCACAPLPQQQAEGVAFAVPAAWSGAAPQPANGSASLVQWWRRFNDPMLGTLVEQALEANTTVRSAQAALRQARALRDAAAGHLAPTLDASAGAQTSRSGGIRSQRFTVGLDAGWELDLFGANRSALAAGEATAQASAASLGEVQVSVAAEVALAYIALRNAQARLAIATANLAGQDETLQIVRWRQQAGLVAVLDVEQARAAAEQTRAQLPALRTSIVQNSHALAVLTGAAPASLEARLAQAAPLPRADGELALRIPADTLRQRADVRAAEWQLRAAMARVGQAQAAQYPSFRLGGSLGLGGASFAALGEGGALATSLLTNVALPIFDGGALRSQTRAQQAALDQARIAYQAAVLTALQDVEDALIALREDRLRLSSLQQAADAASQAAQMAQQRYASGLVDFQVVLDTGRSQMNTQDAVATTSADLSADHVRLVKALGGGWNAQAAAADQPERNPTP